MGFFAGLVKLLNDSNYDTGHKSQIECLAAELTEMLMAEYGWDIRRALDELYSSTKVAMLNGPESGLYYQGVVYIFQFLKSEIETRKIA